MSASQNAPEPESPAIVSDARKDSLIEYPSLFPIKAMGTNVAELVPDLIEIAKQFDADFDETAIEKRPSRAGKYLGVTLTVTATSREQLDALYMALTAHPLVKVVL